MAQLAAPGQAPARDLAAQLEACYQPARQAFARLCPELCPTCPKVCCLRVSPHGLIDQMDLIYYAALDLRGLPYPRPRERGCPFLETQGCALPWRARPFACLHYICPLLRKALPPAELAVLELALEQAGALRSALFKAFLDQ
ncbi:MAG: hypothetical protein V1806_01490 [Pseudomonadota bacterium]